MREKISKKNHHIRDYCGKVFGKQAAVIHITESSANRIIHKQDTGCLQLYKRKASFYEISVQLTVQQSAITVNYVFNAMKSNSHRIPDPERTWRKIRYKSNTGNGTGGTFVCQMSNILLNRANLYSYKCIRKNQ